MEKKGQYLDKLRGRTPRCHQLDYLFSTQGVNHIQAILLIGFRTSAFSLSPLTMNKEML